MDRGKSDNTTVLIAGGATTVDRIAFYSMGSSRRGHDGRFIGADGLRERLALGRARIVRNDHPISDRVLVREPDGEWSRLRAEPAAIPQ